MINANWLEQASLGVVEQAFPDAMVGVKNREALLRAVADVEDKLERNEEDLYTLECALVVETGRIGEENNTHILIRDIEEYFLIRDFGDDLGDTVLSSVIRQGEALAEKYKTDMIQLELLDEKLCRISGFIDWILLSMDREPENCSESMEYYQKMHEKVREITAQITKYRILLCEVPGKAKIHEETVRDLHEMSILELHALLEQGEKTKKIKELQWAAELENQWYRTPEVDLCDKWLLLGIPVKNKSTLNAIKLRVKKNGLQKVTVPNTLHSKLTALKAEIPQLEADADRMVDPKAKPSRFWRALMALLLCGAMLYLGWSFPEKFAEIFDGGFGIIYALAGYAFAAGLLGGGFLYGILFFFLSGFVMLYLIVVGGILSGRAPLHAGITVIVLFNMGICMLCLLWRLWTSRHALRNSSGVQKALLKQLKETLQEAEAGSACCAKLSGYALQLKADKAYERYHALEVQFDEIRKRIQKYL